MNIILFPVDLAYGIESWGRFTTDWQRNERLYKMKFRKHNAYVLHTVPSDKRLVHYSKDGWEPICEYLGHEVPEEPYPHQNKNANLLQVQRTKSPLFRKIMFEFKVMASVAVAVIAPLIFWFYFPSG